MSKIGLLDWDGAAERAELTVTQLKTQHKLKRGPAFVRLTPKVIRFRPEDIDAWTADREVVRP